MEGVSHIQFHPFKDNKWENIQSARALLIFPIICPTNPIVEAKIICNDTESVSFTNSNYASRIPHILIIIEKPKEFPEHCFRKTVSVNHNLVIPATQLSECFIPSLDSCMEPVAKVELIQYIHAQIFPFVLHFK